MLQKSMKITLLGEGRVGKSSIIQRYASGKFEEEHKSSSNADHVKIPLKSADNSREITVYLWDTAGQEQFRCIAPMYYKDSDAVILVYSVVDERSFNELKFWIDEVKEKARENCIVVIAGNQADRIEEEKVSPRKAMEFATKNNALYFSTSAKEGFGIIEMIKTVVEKKFSGFWTVPEKLVIPANPALLQSDVILPEAKKQEQVKLPHQQLNLPADLQNANPRGSFKVSVALSQPQAKQKMCVCT